MKFAVVDVETTGINLDKSRVVEVGIVLIDDFQIISSHSFLLNAGNVPGEITALTGITNKLVEACPVFADVAVEINDLTSDRIFCGHHVSFDYSFIRMEMELAGLKFSRKTVCTAKTAKFLFPSNRSFSLRSLCARMQVVNSRPHRALPDAMATAGIFLKMYDYAGKDLFETIVKREVRSKSATVSLNKFIDPLPETPGVYYFIGPSGKPVYVGKAKNIRSRVKSHFRGEGNSINLVAYADELTEIRYTESGTELMAALIEDHEIRHYWPRFNRSQKTPNKRFGVVFYMDMKGRWRIALSMAFKSHYCVRHFHQYHLAAAYRNRLVEEYGLDPRLCGIPDSNNTEFPDHNPRFLEMIKEIGAGTGYKVFFAEGRVKGEKGFVLLKNEMYCGTGFISRTDDFSLKNFIDNLIPRYSSVTVENLLESAFTSIEPDVVFKNTAEVPYPELLADNNVEA